MKRFRLLAFGFFILMLVIFTGCPEKSASEECKHFYKDLDSNERESSFATFDLEKQLRLYRCGLDRMPHDTSHSIQIAKRGEVIVPDLLRKLENDRDPVTQYGIILVLEMMTGSGNLRNHVEVIHTINRAIADMPAGWWKDYSKKSLSRINEDQMRINDDQIK